MINTLHPSGVPASHNVHEVAVGRLRKAVSALLDDIRKKVDSLLGTRQEDPSSDDEWNMHSADYVATLNNDRVPTLPSGDDVAERIVEKILSSRSGPIKLALNQVA